MGKEVIVISLGGSVILSEDSNQSYFQELKMFLETLSETVKIFLIVGGGKTARFYIQRGRTQGFTEKDLDLLGIQSTRMNAFFLTLVLDGCNKEIPTTVDDAIQLKHDIIVMGGTSPGHSTDFVGAELSCRTHANMYIVATNVDGVYEKDPRLHPSAKLLSTVSIDSLLAQYGNHWDSAGKNMVIDGPALQKIKDYKIPTYVINGNNIQEMEHIIHHKPFLGTKIKI